MRDEQSTLLPWEGVLYRNEACSILAAVLQSPRDSTGDAKLQEPRMKLRSSVKSVYVVVKTGLHLCIVFGTQIEARHRRTPRARRRIHPSELLAQH